MKTTKFYYNDSNAPKPNRTILMGVAVLVRYEDTVLMEYRSDSDVWAFIGGSLEVGETQKQGAVRELQEETGIVLDEGALTLFQIYDDPSRIIAYPDGNIFRSISTVFEAVLNEMPILICSEESRELRFQKICDLERIPLAATHIPIMQDLLDNYERKETALKNTHNNEYFDLGLNGSAPLKVILCGKTEYVGNEKVGVVSVVYATNDRAKAETRMNELMEAHPDRYYMVYSVPLDEDLTTLSHFPSIEITRDDLKSGGAE
ncbi:MAG: NUDIX domain-containing protein [Lachnospiraceae bacterium]|nr:NUDIX domain-containing protein [Lachnospiraceae bacterium]